MCGPARLLDLVENFTLFQEVPGGLIKILAKNHQVLGVNNALVSLRNIEGNHGRLGVFWHTQGSGKSFSMIFFAQKALRKVSGKYSFVVVTDRTGEQVPQSGAAQGTNEVSKAMAARL